MFAQIQMCQLIIANWNVSSLVEKNVSSLQKRVEEQTEGRILESATLFLKANNIMSLNEFVECILYIAETCSIETLSISLLKSNTNVRHMGLKIV